MLNEETYEYIDTLIETAENTLNSVDLFQDELKEAYRNSFFYPGTADYEDGYSLSRERALPSTVKNIMTTVIKDLNQIKATNFSGSGMLTKRLEDMTQDYIGSLYSMLSDHDEIASWYDAYDYISWTDEFRAISILTQFANIESNIVLIGSNGSGKSTLAKILKGNDSERITVIPAQKSMFFTADSSVLSTRVNDAKDHMLTNSIELSKEDSDYGFSEYQKYQFTRLLVAMREEYFSYLRNCHEADRRADHDQCIYDKVRHIIKSIFKDIDIFFGNTFDEYIYCRRNNESYSLNGLSEGEKAALFYSMSVLMAPEDGFIVVDEPETFLNPSLANTLWDMLTNERDDCQFIFITHSVNFTLARNDAQIIWIKNFTYPDQFTFEKIDDNFSLPKTMMTEILGSKNPILFCEGNDKTSLDYKVYSGLLHDNYTVIPVGGHKEVENYCRLLNKATWIGVEAKGIVDGDMRNDDNISKLNSQNITVLPFNEIEMLLMEDDVLRTTIKGSHPSEFERIVNDFKQEFWKYFSKQKDVVAINKLKMNINYYLENKKIDKCKSIGEIKHNLENIVSLDVENMLCEIRQDIDQVIITKDYTQLLNKCNLKKEISRGLANKYLDSDYESKAIEYISTDKELQKKLLDKYF